jgi:hypothetical protein
MQNFTLTWLSVFRVQHIFRYADPLYVTAETINNYHKEGLVSDQTIQKLKNAIWWQTLLTTRTLLAHAVSSTDSSTFVPTIASNIRAHLRLVNIEIADKEAFESLRSHEPKAWYKPTKEDGKWYLDLHHAEGWQKGTLKDTDDIVKELRSASYAVMEAEFHAMKMGEDDDVKRVIRKFGHSAYVLVATRDNLWKQSANEYRCVQL